MPLLLSCDELEVGMSLAESFFAAGRRVIAGGRPLAEEYISALRTKYPQARVRVSDPVLESLVEFQDDSRERDAATAVRQLVATALRGLFDRFSASRDLSGTAPAAVQAIDEALRFMRANPICAIIPDLDELSLLSWADRGGRVTYLSLLLASAARDYVLEERCRQTVTGRLSAKVTNDLLPLGLGAMLCDVGLFEYPQFLDGKRKLTDADRAAAREHPAKGADLLPETLPAGVKAIVRTHHENHDGTGHPKGLAGSGLHVFGRLVRICDAFVTATTNDEDGKRETTPRALWEMQSGQRRTHFDPALVKFLVKVVQPFPVGSKVLLEDGRGGIVARYNFDNSFQPQILIAFDAQGRRLPVAEMVAAGQSPEGQPIRIRSYAGEDLSYLYTAGTQPSAPANLSAAA